MTAANTLDVIVKELVLKAEPEAAPTPDEANNLGLTVGDLAGAVVRNLRLPTGIDGAVVNEVVADSPGDRAGVEVDDVVRRVNRHAVRNAADAKAEFRHIEAGAPVFLFIWRKGDDMLIEIAMD